MRLVIILLFFLSFNLINGNLHEKCCKFNERIKKENSTFSCELNVNKRLESNFNNTDYYNKNEIGTCVDVFSEKIVLFSVNNERKIVKKSDTDVKFFPKCCPLSYLYNETLHSCVQKNETTNNILIGKILKKDKFIKIGLPECIIISDKILNSEEKFILNENEVIFKENEEKINYGKYCIDTTSNEKFVIRICEENVQICSQVRCIHKCCPDGQSFFQRSNCVDTLKHGVDLHSTSRIKNPDDPFAIIHGITKPIYRMTEDKYKYYVDRFGLFVSYMNQTETFESYEVTNLSYCMEHAYRENFMNGYGMFSTNVKQVLATKFVVTRWVKLVSCFFLLLTILVYLALPKVRNLFGKILLSYSISTFLLFLFLALSQFYYAEFSDEVCKIIGFLSVLTSIWSFTWLHIMCIDIWFSFGTPRTLTGPLQKSEWKRLFQYSLYGWCLPIIWVLLILFFSSTDILPESIKPYVGEHKCYMENTDSIPGNYAYFVFVTLPLLTQQIVNTILFIKTIRYCLKIKAEIERMNDSKRQTELSASKERLGLIMKLAVIMGISFLFETISSMFDFRKTAILRNIEVVWDTINCLQGFFIFVIFICKRKILNSIRAKIPIFKSRKTSVSSSATAQVSLHQIGESKSYKD